MLCGCSYFKTEFCPRNKLAPALVKEQLKIFIATVAAVQVGDPTLTPRPCAVALPYPDLLP